MNNNQDNGTNGGSIYSKFRERLRKIKLSRMKKKKQNEEFIQERVKEIREELVVSPRLQSKGMPEQLKVEESIKMDNVTKVDDSISKVIVDIKDTAAARNYGRKRVASLEDEIKDCSIDNSGKNISDVDVINDERLDKIIEGIRTNKPRVKRTKRMGISNEKVSDLSDISKQELLREIGMDIIDKIKSSFEDKLDELEVLESELYILSQMQNEELELNKVKDIKKRINELIDKLNIIIEQYNLYKNNYYIDNVIGIDDIVIMDDIINYRDLLDSFDAEKKFVKEYKALEEFKSLYQSLVEIKDETDKLQLENDKKIEEYKIRDKKYDDINLGMVSSLEIDKKCSLEIDKQNKYFNELMSKIDVINKEEYVTTHLKGVGNLIGQSLRYMGLMLISPFTGMLPGIAMQTLATRKLVANAYQNLHYEDVRQVHYDVVNYDSDLNHHLMDVNYTEDLINDTIRDVNRLKEDFMMIYNSSIPGYDDTLRDIKKIEEKLLRSQNKVSIVKKNLKMSKKLNEDKLIRVRELNNN